MATTKNVSTENKINIVTNTENNVTVTQPSIQAVEVLTGPKGNKGDTGPTGPPGPSGSVNTGSLVTTSSFNSYTGSSSSQFAGTASLATTSTNANKVYIDWDATDSILRIPMFAGIADGYYPLKSSLNELTYYYRAGNPITGDSQASDYLYIGGGANTAGGIFLNSTVTRNNFIYSDFNTFYIKADDQFGSENPLYPPILHLSTYSGSGGEIILDTPQVTISSSVNISSSLTASGLNYPIVDGDEKQLLSTDSEGRLSFDWADRTNIDVKNTSGVTLTIGTPIYITGYQGASIFQIAAASASDATKMPAIGVLDQDLSPNGQGYATLIGALRGYSTTDCSVNDSLYVGEGLLTKTRPTGSSLVQKIARVGNVAINGEITILGAGRTNDIPNITPGYAWVGNSDGVAVPVATSSFGGESVGGNDQEIQFNSGSTFGTDFEFRYIYPSSSLKQGNNNIITGRYSHVAGESNVLTGRGTYVNGRFNSGSSNWSTAVGRSNILTVDSDYSFVGGYLSKVSSSFYGFAFGESTFVYGNHGFAIGQETSASFYGFALGSKTKASFAARAAGRETVANSRYTHTEGVNTQGGGEFQRLFTSSATEPTTNWVDPGSDINNGDVWYNTSNSLLYAYTGSGTLAAGFVSQDSASVTVPFFITSSGTLTTATFGSGDVFPAASSSAVLAARFNYDQAYYSHAEGSGNKTYGRASHAEGYFNQAGGYASHVEGYFTRTGKINEYGAVAQGGSGSYAHAEGWQTQANGIASHAEGFSARSRGNYSHAQGKVTIAEGDYQHTMGHYNETNTTSLVIIGNGTSSNNRKNLVEFNLGGVLINQPITASSNISSSGTFYGDGSGITGVISSSYALTASHALNAGGGGAGFPFTGDAVITGSLVVSASATSQSLSVQGSGSTVFDVIGSVGTLFSIDDDLNGMLFTANDISGFPVLQASASGDVLIGKTPQSLYTTAVISSTTAATTHSLCILSTSSYDGAFFEYTAISQSNARAGNIMSVWNGANIVSTETTSSQIGNTTDLTTEVIISGSTARLVAYGANAGYKIKTIIKAI